MTQIPQKEYNRCNTMMSGYSGTSRNGTKHQYYHCPKAKKKLCSLHNVRKDYLEDVVVNKITEMLTDENILQIVGMLAEIDERQKDKTNLLRLKKSLKENQTATANIIKAIEKGIAEESLLSQLEKRETERKALEEELELEKYNVLSITKEEYAFFLKRMVQKAAHDLQWRRALIDSFVNKIYIYEDDEGKPKK